MSQVLGDPEDESTRGKEGRVGREVPWPPGGVKVMWGLNSSPRKGKVVARAIAFPACLKLPSWRQVFRSLRIIPKAKVYRAVRRRTGAFYLQSMATVSRTPGLSATVHFAGSLAFRHFFQG